MEFEIKDLEIIDNQNQPSELSKSHLRNQDSTIIQTSMILKEVQAENEELQTKLKLNQRRLLLFETENNKLLEEKNKYFFETQSYVEKNQILTERNEELIKSQAELLGSQKLLIEKIASLENINKTQLNEIKRFTKFHTKIQDVVKPLLTQLKEQIKNLKSELLNSQKLNSHLNATLHDLKRNSELQVTQKDQIIAAAKIEKSNLIKTYEEQIHAFSKEILHLQSQNAEQHQEISRLKKAIEFKNYFENEVIRFKRTHEEDQVQIQDLQQKKAQLEARILSIETHLNETTFELTKLKTNAAESSQLLDATREQLSKKIEELNKCYERLSRLEKLNAQLSREISVTIQN